VSIYQKGNKRVLFIHIPKTGGTSIRHLLHSEGWEKIEDPQLPDHLRNEIIGDRSSKHQHKTLRDCWRESWDYEFSMVRNPYERFLSQVKHICVARREMGYASENSGMPTSDGTMNVFDSVHNSLVPKMGKGIDDNHFRPQSEFISEDTQVFKLESQKEEAVDFLKSNGIISHNASFPHFHESMPNSPNLIVAWPLRKALHDQFLSFYCDDFKNFGYSKDVPTYGLKIDWSRIK
jgi:hypothetical protein